MAKFQVHTLSKKKYEHTVWWAVILSILIVGAISMLARATHNFNAALIEKPDVAIYILLPDLRIRETTVVRETNTERDYLARTATGPMLVKMKKGAKEWFIDSTETLHGASAQSATETPQPQ